MEIPEQLAQAMKAIRKRRGLTQIELAEKMGVADRTISLIETGINAPSMETLVLFLTALEISPRDLFSFDSDEAGSGRAEKIAVLIDAANELSDEALDLAAQMVQLLADHQLGQA